MTRRRVSVIAATAVGLWLLAAAGVGPTASTLLEQQTEAAAETCASALERSDRYDRVVADQPGIVEPQTYRDELDRRRAEGRRPGLVAVFRSVCRGRVDPERLGSVLADVRSSLEQGEPGPGPAEAGDEVEP